MKRCSYGTIVIASILFLMTLGCNRPDENITEENVAPVIMTVGGSDIDQGEYQFYLAKSYPELSQNDGDNELQSFVLDKFKRDLVIAEFAKHSGLRVTEEQVDEFINTRMTTISFNLLPPEEQARWRVEIQRRLAIQHFLQREILSRVTVTEEEISNYYQNNQNRFTREPRYNIRIAQTETEETADELFEALRKSKEPFIKVVEPFAVNEGYTIATPLFLKDLPEPFQASLKQMTPGRHSKVIPIQYGEVTTYYVLYLESILPEETLPYEEAYHLVRKDLERKIAASLMDERMRQFEKIIKINIHLENLPFKYIPPSQRKST